MPNSLLSDPSEIDPVTGEPLSDPTPAPQPASSVSTPDQSYKTPAPTKSMGPLISDEVLSDMYTFPSIDKRKYFSKETQDILSKVGIADTTVYQGNFVSRFSESVGRSAILGNMKNAGFVFELTGKTLDEVSEGGSADVFGKKLRNFGLFLGHEADRLLAQRQEEFPLKPGVEMFAADVVSSTLTTIGLVALGTGAATLAGAGAEAAAVAGSITAISTIGAMSGSERFSKAQAAGQDYGTSLAFGIVDGVVNAQLERVGLDKIFKVTFTKGISIVRDRIAAAMAAEGLTEGLQTAVELGFDIASGSEKDMTPAEYASQVLYASAVGLVSGGAMTAMVAIPQRSEAIKALKAAGMDDAKAKQVYKETVQEAADNILNDLSKEFDYSDIQNQATQKSLNVMQEYLTRRTFDRAAFEQEMADMKQLDPARAVLGAIRAQAAADAESEMKPKTPVSRTGIDSIIENIGLSETTTPEPRGTLKVREPVFSVDTEPAMRNAITGRIRYLNDQMDALNKEARAISKRVKDLEKAGKPVDETTKNREATIFQSIVEKYVEADTLRTNPKGANLKGQEITIKTKDLIVATGNLAKSVVRAANQNFKSGKIAGREELLFIRTVLNNLVKAPGLSRDAQVLLKNKFMNIRTPEQLSKSLPLIEDAVTQAQNDIFITGLKGGIDKLSDLFSGRGTGPERKVKLDLDSQRIADAFVKEYKNESTDPRDRLRLLDGTPENIMRFLASQAATGKNGSTGEDLTPRDYANIYNTLYDFAYDGRNSKLFQVEREKNFRKRVAKKVSEDILGGKASVDESFKNADFTDWVLSQVTNFIGTYDGFLGLLGRHAEAALGESFSEIALGMNSSLRQAEALNIFFRSEVDRAMLTSFALSDHSKINAKLEQDSSPTSDTAVSFSYQTDDGEVDVVLSRAEAREKKLLSLRPDGEKKLRKSGWTDEAFSKLDESLTTGDNKFIAEQLRIYEELYGRLNEVFSRIAGFDLPRSRNYSPIYTEQDITDGISMVSSLFEAGQGDFTNVQNKGMFKNVTDKKVKLRDVSDFEKLYRYIHDVSHYVGTAETVQRVDAVLRDSDVRDAIKSRYGEGIIDSVERYVEVLAKNSYNVSGNKLLTGWNRAVTKLTQGLIAAKPVQIIKQTTSMFTAMELTGPINYMKYLAGMSDAITSGEIKELTDTAFFRARGQLRTMSRDVRQIQEALEYDRQIGVLDFIPGDNLKELRQRLHRLTTNKKMTDLFFLPTQLGDFTGLLPSAWVAYKHFQTQIAAENPSMTSADVKASARIKAIEFANATQQSGDMTQVSPWMLSNNPFMRLVTAFKQAPLQYMNRVLRIMQTAGTDKWDWNKFGKMYFVYFFLLPHLYDYVSKAFGFGDEDWRVKGPTTAVLGPFEDAILAGPIFQWAVASSIGGLVSAATGEEIKPPKLRPGDVLGVGASIAENLQQAQDALRKTMEDGVTPAEFFKFTTELSEASLPITGGYGALARQISNSIEGVVLGMDGEFVKNWKRYLMTLGYSRSVTKPDGSSSKSKKRANSYVYR